MARDATPCSSADARSGLETGAGPVGTPPVVGRRNILSIVGRRAAPNGVDKKSVGRSRDKFTFTSCY